MNFLTNSFLCDKTQPYEILEILKQNVTLFQASSKMSRNLELKRVHVTFQSFERLGGSRLRIAELLDYTTNHHDLYQE